MTCANFNENRKRCQQAKCDGCKDLAVTGVFPYKPLTTEGTGLGIDH